MSLSNLFISTILNCGMVTLYWFEFESIGAVPASMTHSTESVPPNRDSSRVQQPCASIIISYQVQEIKGVVRDF